MTSTTTRRAVGTAVILPGTGSDEVFVRAAFQGPADAARLRLVTPAPVHGTRLAEHHLAALDAAAARYGPIVAGGISLGAHVAAEWALRNPQRCAGLVVAMPGWYGNAGFAPGSLAAAASADLVESVGVDQALAIATRDVPGWLADELNRAWRRAGDDLADSLRVATSRAAPTLERLRDIAVPAGVVGCTDDPVHPIEIARQWAAALPSARLRTITLADFGTGRAALGAAALAASAEAGLGGIVGMGVRMQDRVGDGHTDQDGIGQGVQGQR